MSAVTYGHTVRHKSGGGQRKEKNLNKTFDIFFPSSFLLTQFYLKVLINTLLYLILCLQAFDGNTMLGNCDDLLIDCSALLGDGSTLLGDGAILFLVFLPQIIDDAVICLVLLPQIIDGATLFGDGATLLGDGATLFGDDAVLFLVSLSHFIDHTTLFGDEAVLFLVSLSHFINSATLFGDEAVLCVVLLPQIIDDTFLYIAPLLQIIDGTLQLGFHFFHGLHQRR